MRKLFFIVVILFAHRAFAEMIFLDLNDAKDEIKNCQEGVAQNASDKISVIQGEMGEANDGRTMTYHKLKNALTKLRQEKRSIDSIVISGEDGSGHFFGVNGDFHQDELRQLTKDFPEFGQSLQSAAIWGCYTTSVHAAEQYWLNRLPNMQFTMGFTLQGPEKSRPANHLLLKQFCQRRNEAVKATSLDQLCKFYDSLLQLTRTSVGICNRVGIASAEYQKNKEKCFTYKELHERCGEFTKNVELERTYQRYLTGEQTPEDEKTGGPTHPLRNYYNELNLWRHCREQFKADRGYDMPFLPEVIRLLKYNKIRKNLSQLNAKELADYDQQLQKAGLGSFALGDISNPKMSRAEMNWKIEQAVSALRGQAVQVQVPASWTAKKAALSDGGFLFGEEEDQPAHPAVPSVVTVKGVKNPTLLRMTQCLRMTLVNMDYRCTQFKNINEHMGDPSPCIMSYKRARVKGEDDDC